MISASVMKFVSIVTVSSNICCNLCIAVMLMYVICQIYDNRISIFLSLFVMRQEEAANETWSVLLCYRIRTNYQWQNGRLQCGIFHAHSSLARCVYVFL